ncbi:La-related protein 7 [Porites harrisoni]
MNSQDLVKLSADNEEHKQHKKRTKKIKAQLKDQVEFYFGDANLLKDRFMKQEINKHPEGYVAISTIANFNRMKKITDDMNLVIKAMKMSPILEVSEDETMVRRKAPVPEPRNVDAETIYVERLPPYADHDWVKEIFSKYGKVVYVSIPRFKHTGDIKGFAFVEFESALQAQEALQVFNKGGKTKQDAVPEEKTENSPSVVQSIEQQKVSKGKRKRSLSESELDTQQKHKERKRKRTISDSSDTEQHDDIQQKTEDMKNKDHGKERKENGRGKSTDEAGENEKSKKSVRWEEGQQEEIRDNKKSEETTSVVSRKRSHEESVINEDEVQQKRQKISDKSEESGEDETAERNKKQKKRKRKKKEKKETRLPHLRVISKLEWLELKKEYKNLQREAMNKLKKQLQEKSSADGNKTEEQKYVKPPQNGTTKGRDIKSNEPKQTDIKKLPYTPGVVLKFYCKGSGLTKRELRDKFSSYSPVAYLDLAEGEDEGHVRFHTTENCNSVFTAMSSTSDKLKVEKLTEEAEKAYWEKINADRMVRFNSKRQKKRGTEKVARKAEALQLQRQSHIRFDESEDEEHT